jgi:hypothetical protein
MDSIKKFLALSFSDLIKVFQDKFATLLLSEISKQLKKGNAAAASGSTPAEETKSEKSSKRGSKHQIDASAEVEMIEEEEKLLSGKRSSGSKKKKRGGEDDEENNVAAGDSGEDDANESDHNSDIDGAHKSAKEMQGYDDVDEGGDAAAMDDGEEQSGKRRSDS